MGNIFKGCSRTCHFAWLALDLEGETMYRVTSLIRNTPLLGPYRGTSLIKDSPLLGPYRRSMPRFLGIDHFLEKNILTLGHLLVSLEDAVSQGRLSL